MCDASHGLERAVTIMLSGLVSHVVEKIAQRGGVE
jgi:hypothetical protein